MGQTPRHFHDLPTLNIFLSSENTLLRYARFGLKKMPFLKIRLKSGLWDLFIHILVAQNHSPPNLSMGPF